MNLNYITGFFDADGSITLSNATNYKFKSIQISFHNTQINILEDIQKYLLDKYSLKGYISTKPAKKLTHSTSYDLKYSGNYAYNLCFLLNSIHPKKKFRIETIIKYYKMVTIRNGKYSDTQFSKKLAFERLFFIKS